MVNSSPRSTVEDSRLDGETDPAEPVPASFRKWSPAPSVSDHALPLTDCRAFGFGNVAMGTRKTVLRPPLSKSAVTEPSSLISTDWKRPMGTPF